MGCRGHAHIKRRVSRDCTLRQAGTPIGSNAFRASHTDATTSKMVKDAKAVPDGVFSSINPAFLFGNEGLVVGGTPIGSNAFRASHTDATTSKMVKDAKAVPDGVFNSINPALLFGNEGLVVGGTPIGSNAFQASHTDATTSKMVKDAKAVPDGVFSSINPAFLFGKEVDGAGRYPALLGTGHASPSTTVVAHNGVSRQLYTE